MQSHFLQEKSVLEVKSFAQVLLQEMLAAASIVQSTYVSSGYFSIFIVAFNSSFVTGEGKFCLISVYIGKEESHLLVILLVHFDLFLRVFLFLCISTLLIGVLTVSMIQ